MLKHRFTIRTLLLTIAILGILFAIGRLVIVRRLAADDLNLLLRGDDKIDVTMISTEYQQRRLICTDKEVLSYLAAALRQSRMDRMNAGNGITYQFAIRFSTGRRYRLLGYIDINHWSLAVPSADPIENCWATHEIPLSMPMSDRVNTIFEFLNAPWEQVGGLSLTIPDNQPVVYQYDPSLHGGNPVGSRVAQLVGTTPNR